MNDVLHGIEGDVRFDHNAASLLASGCRNAATAIDGQAASRASWVTHGMTDFKGYYSQLFQQNGTTQAGDATRLAAALRDVATKVDHLASCARAEQNRRTTARAWKKRQDDRGLWDHVSDWFTGGEAPPVGGPDPVAPQSVPAPAAPQRQPLTGSGSSGTSSARPDHLRTFATNSAGANQELSARPGTLRGHYNTFVAGCGWGSLDASGVFTGFDNYLTANGQDVQRANTVAAAFEAAGGSGVVTMSNATITASLPGGLHLAAGGQVTFAGLEWLGERVHDPATRGFLSPDPLEAVAGVPWSGSPYSYAGNDPLHAVDPTGLAPVTDAELAAYTHTHHTGSFWERNGTTIIGGLMVVGGVAAMFLIPPPAGAMIGGGLASAGINVVQQSIANPGQPIDLVEVGLNGVLGAVPIGRAATLLGAFGRGAVVGATSGAITAGYTNWRDGVTGWDAVANMAMSMGQGALFGGTLNGIGHVATTPRPSTGPTPPAAPAPSPELVPINTGASPQLALPPGPSATPQLALPPGPSATPQLALPPGPPPPLALPPGPSSPLALPSGAPQLWTPSAPPGFSTGPGGLYVPNAPAGMTTSPSGLYVPGN